MLQKLNCKAEVEEEQWNVSLMVPIEILECIYGELYLKEGTKFNCNFYKICETKENEHYASYEYVKSKNPNFHLPEYFAEAVITAGNKRKYKMLIQKIIGRSKDYENLQSKRLQRHEQKGS